MAALIKNASNGALDEGPVVVAGDDHGELRIVGHEKLQRQFSNEAFDVGSPVFG